jgi:tripartite-type tricarboxylate transporter receptor subunit TctC
MVMRIAIASDLLSNLGYLPLVRAGSIKAYAVMSDRRLEIAPDIPTFAEMGLPTMARSVWFGLFAPKGTPNEIIGSLNAAVVEALADPAVRSRLVDLGFEILPPERRTPEALRALQNADAEIWWPIGRPRISGGNDTLAVTALGPGRVKTLAR